ncbi:MAG TPA: ATP-binding protein [Acidimicrobiia bacterium]|nr:ATP-binding protein [Acidimicrobiia bacterium]
MTQVVELEIPARPEFVGIARMAVSALAGIRPGLPYERVDDLRIVVSEACTSAIEAALAHGSDGARVLVRCLDSPEVLEVCIDGGAGAFDPAIAETDPSGDDFGFRISLIQALVDEAEVRPSHGGTELRLVLRRDAGADDALDGEPGDDADLPV